jgi:hypothetical protein
MRLLSLLLVMAMLPIGASAQSLGDAARKEEQRRQKNKEKGVKAPVFDDSKIAKTGAAAPAPAASTGTAPSAAPAAASSSHEVSPAPDLADVEAEQRKLQEEMWRGRMTAARTLRDEAQKRHDYLKSLFLGPSEYFVDEKGQVLVRDVEHLRQLIAEAKAKWDAAEQAIRDLEESARRAGALPGWLR